MTNPKSTALYSENHGLKVGDTVRLKADHLESSHEAIVIEVNGPLIYVSPAPEDPPKGMPNTLRIAE